MKSETYLNRNEKSQTVKEVDTLSLDKSHNNKAMQASFCNNAK